MDESKLNALEEIVADAAKRLVMLHARKGTLMAKAHNGVLDYNGPLHDVRKEIREKEMLLKMSFEGARSLGYDLGVEFCEALYG